MTLDIRAAAPAVTPTPPPTPEDDKCTGGSCGGGGGGGGGDTPDDPVDEIKDIMKDTGIPIPEDPEILVIQIVYIYVFLPSCKTCEDDTKCSGDDCYDIFVLEKHKFGPEPPKKLVGCKPGDTPPTQYRCVARRYKDIVKRYGTP
jgi:hypothetical protein